MTRRVLIVEDYADVREMYAMFLSENGFEVIEAADGFQAMAILQGTLLPFDLAIMDLGLPRLSGIDVIRRLRAEPRTATLPIVCVTGHAGAKPRADALAAGADLVLAKPCLPEDLLAAILGVLGMEACAALAGRR